MTLMGLVSTSPFAEMGLSLLCNDVLNEGKISLDHTAYCLQAVILYR